MVRSRYGKLSDNNKTLRLGESRLVGISLNVERFLDFPSLPTGLPSRNVWAVMVTRRSVPPVRPKLPYASVHSYCLIFSYHFTDGAIPDVSRMLR